MSANGVEPAPHAASAAKSLTEPRSVAERVRPLVRTHLHAISPYVPGRSANDVQREFGLTDVVKLASNENPLGPSPKAVVAIEKILWDLNRYPDGAAMDIRQAVADHLNLEPSNVLVGNGSDEVIKMLSETFLQPGDELIVADTTFAQYGFGAKVMNATLVQVPMLDGFQYDLQSMLDHVTERTKMVYLCSPNNPTGTWLTHTEVRWFLDRIPEHVLVALDEAYVEYVDAPDPLDSLQFIREGRSVLSLRTFSKIHGLAGLRLGYVLADAAVIAYINQVREPFNANAVAQAAAVAALSDIDHVTKSRAANKACRQQYYEGLARQGIPYIETQGNFLLAEVGDGYKVFEDLQRLGVIVRAGFPGLERYVRISIGTQEENERCLQALEKVLRS